MIDWQQFKTADVMARLATFQAHLEQGGLAAEDAFQMLDSIHAALEQQHGGRHLAYSQYAGLMRQRQRRDSALYDQVVARYFANGDPRGPADDHVVQEPPSATHSARVPTA
jgi:hypothetical protein